MNSPCLVLYLWVLMASLSVLLHCTDGGGSTTLSTTTTTTAPEDMRVERPGYRDSQTSEVPPQNDDITESEDLHISNTVTSSKSFKQVAPPSDHTVKHLKGDRGPDIDGSTAYRPLAHAPSTKTRHKNDRYKTDDVNNIERGLFRVPDGDRDHIKLENAEEYEDNYPDEEDEEEEDIGMDMMQADFPSRSLRGTSRSSSKGGRRKMVKRPGCGMSPAKNMEGYSYEYRIKQKILLHYEKNIRPVRNDSTETTVYIGMSLYHILDTNEKMQTLSALIAVRLRWMDEYLTWDEKEYGGVDKIWIPALLVWTPDIFINNFADDSFKDFMDTFAIISSNGQVLWMFPAVVKTYCTLDVRHFPFDRQKCNIVFISWTFNGLKLNVTYNESEHQAIYYTPKNQEWYVDQVTVERHEKIYACCPEPYPDVTFTIHMTRRSLFYIINLIFPCLLIYAVSFLGFFLPVESGEKVNLEITILLALVVFLLIVGETLPPTPDAIPALGMLFGLTMIMVSIALVMAVIVTNIFLRKDSGHRVPTCLRRLCLKTRSRRDSLTNKVTMAENHVNEVKLPEIELDNLSILSEIEGLTSHRNNVCNNSMRRSNVSKQPSALDLEHMDRRELEWRTLAKCVDKIFFWLFLFSSIGSLVAMFSTIPQYNAT